MQPNAELSRQSQDTASALFAQLYLSPKGEDMKPVDALAMFYEYRELTPIGRRGDEMIRRLAERLAAIDLLDQAAELLQYQVDKRLEGAARAQVAARLAMVYLTNRKPDKAIAALRSTRIADLSGELRQQRLLLEARAQSDVGRHDLALDIISNITGREAIRLRSDIYWASRQWREASEQIELYYADRWRDFKPLNAAEKGDVIRAVVGYALAEDAIGLARFREKYAPLMTGEGDKFAFETASKPAASNSAEFALIAKMAASVDTLDGFIREMKLRFPDATARAPRRRKWRRAIRTTPAPCPRSPASGPARPDSAAIFFVSSTAMLHTALMPVLPPIDEFIVLPAGARSLYEVDRARPGLMAVGLCHAQVDRKIRAAGKPHHMIKFDMAAELGLGQAVNAQLPAKAATIERDDVVSERSKLHHPRDDVCFDAERALMCFVEPQVDARQIARRDRIPCQRRPGRRLPHHSLRIEKIDRRKSRDAIVRDRQFALPQRFAAAAPIFGTLPQHAHAPSEIGRAVRTKRLRHPGSVQHIDPFDRGGTNHLGRDAHRHTARTNNASHRGVLNRKFLCRPKLRVFGKSDNRFVE